ncbi:branched-chain amino acid ABC transporter permease [Bradyrhizobium sp. CCBAU 53421]|nr:branched-chain amino acid ABC transporter permease [Bradyrhizobium sp. CCBAU 53421]
MVSNYLVVFATRILILCIFALSFDLLWGCAGIMSFGQSLFFGAAGYGVALAARDFGVTSLLAVLPIGLLVGFAVATLVGSVLLLGRRQASVVFISMGTLTGSYAAERLARGWYYLGGQNGIPSIPPMTIGPYDLAEGVGFYFASLLLLLIVYAACRFVIASQFGLVLAGLRDGEQRLLYFGYRVQHFKLVTFSVGGAIAGLAGGLYTFHEGFAGPGSLGVVLSTQVVLYVLFGGAGTLIGAVIGTTTIETLGFWFSNSYQEVWPIILGLILVIVITLRPAGLISFLLDRREGTDVPVMPPAAKGGCDDPA